MSPIDEIVYTDGYYPQDGDEPTVEKDLTNDALYAICAFLVAIGLTIACIATDWLIGIVIGWLSIPVYVYKWRRLRN